MFQGCNHNRVTVRVQSETTWLMTGKRFRLKSNAVVTNLYQLFGRALNIAVTKGLERMTGEVKVLSS